MKVIAAAALIASSFTPVVFPPFVSAAAANPSNGNLCNLTQSASSGWSCQEVSGTSTYYSVGQSTAAGGDLATTCQDYVRTTGDYVGVNPAGHAVGAFSTNSVTTDTPVGGPYDGTYTGCNYPEQ